MLKLLIFLYVMALCGHTEATTLGDIAASMKAGEWRQLSKPANASSIGVMNIAVYSDSWVWNPIAKKGMFIGSYHGGPRCFAIYDDAAHAWSRIPLSGSGIPTGNVTSHGFDGNALDPATGNYYFRESNGSKNIFKYSLSGTWSTLPTNSATRTEVNPIAYYPELGGLIWVNTSGEIHLFKESTQQWSKLGNAGISFRTWNIAEYNPVHKTMIIGCGNSKELCKLSSDGKVTRLGNMPIAIYDGSGFPGHVTVDPISGDYIVLTAKKMQLYSYNVQTDTWKNLNNPPLAAMQNGASIAASVGTYGINLFMSCGYYSFAPCLGDLFVYKHTTGSTNDNARPYIKKSVDIKVSPSPFTGGKLSIHVASNHGDVRIFNLNGQEIICLKAQRTLTWDGKQEGRKGKIAPGVYLIRLVQDGTLVGQQKIAVVR